MKLTRRVLKKKEVKMVKNNIDVYAELLEEFQQKNYYQNMAAFRPVF
jgi:hypothetical protein